MATMTSVPDYAPKFDDQPADFESPPVNEVYLSIQTKGAVFPSADFGVLAKIFAVRFPKLNVQPKLDRLVEGKPVTEAPTITFELVNNPGQRFWLISSDDTRVIQVQEDRFVYNWRRRGVDPEYPRYHIIRTEFEREIRALLSELQLGDSDLADFCEVSYTNHINVPGSEDPRASIHRIFRHFGAIDLGLSKVTLEESSFVWTFAVKNEQDEFVGRMRIIAGPAFKTSTGKFIIQNQISFRGRPANASLSSALEFCDRGHFAIVTAFDRITTPEMHAIWGKRNANNSAD